MSEDEKSEQGHQTPHDDTTSLAEIAEAAHSPATPANVLKFKSASCDGPGG